jgi:hypothetical protein
VKPGEPKLALVVLPVVHRGELHAVAAVAVLAVVVAGCCWWVIVHRVGAPAPARYPMRCATIDGTKLVLYPCAFVTVKP